MNLVTWLARAARSDPGRVAIHSGDRPWATYGELALRAARLAGGFGSRLGLERGDRVAIAMKNSPEYLLAMYAAWWAGLAVVPVNAKLHAKEVDFIVRDSGARLLVESPSDLARARPEATRCPSRRARRPTSRGSSTRAAPRGGRRARCSRTATSRR